MKYFVAYFIAGVILAFVVSAQTGIDVFTILMVESIGTLLIVLAGKKN